MPGNTDIHHALNRNRCPAFSIRPQLTMSAEDSPRKLSEASSRIAWATTRVPAASTGAIALGTTSVARMTDSRMPRQRTASTNSSCLMRITSPRVRRAICGHASSTITATTRVSPVPDIATITAARMKLGTTWNISEIRITVRSSQPPKNPAAAPSRTPSRVAPTAALTPTASDTCEPYRMPSSMSRPSSSVPNGCSSEGATIAWSEISCGSTPGSRNVTAAISTRIAT